MRDMTTIHKPNLTPTYESVEVGPPLAQEYLKRNISNRAVRYGTVVAYTKAMTMGRWIANGPPITFDTNGNLIDGQHRLLAIIKSGITIRMMVCRYAPPESAKVIDTGMIKRMGDVMPMDDSTVVYGSMRYLMAYESGIARRPCSKLQPWEAEDILARHPILPHFGRVGRRVGAQLGKGGLTAAPAAFLCYLIGAVRSEQSERFLIQLETGVDLEEGSPVLAFRRAMMSGNTFRNKNHSIAISAVARGIMAWNAFRAERSLTKIVWQGGRFPQADGSPVRVGVAIEDEEG